jgi:Family of unknown function (DUF6496)
MNTILRIRPGNLVVRHLGMKIIVVSHRLITKTVQSLKTIIMAKYSKGAGNKVERAMHEMKEGTLKSGNSDKKVTNRKQAIAIGLSEAREEGKKVPEKATSKKKGR